MRSPSPVIRLHWWLGPVEPRPSLVTSPSPVIQLHPNRPTSNFWVDTRRAVLLEPFKVGIRCVTPEAGSRRKCSKED